MEVIHYLLRVFIYKVEDRYHTEDYEWQHQVKDSVLALKTHDSEHECNRDTEQGHVEEVVQQPLT